MTDSEVEETVNGVTHFAGANLWQLTLSGSVVGTANISRIAPTAVPMTNEPTGIAFRASNGHYLVSDDGRRSVYDLNPGTDGRIGTADDSWTSFSTTANGNPDVDPESIAYDSRRDRVFVADGADAEVYEYTPGGALVRHFDVARYGVADPEGLAYNPAAGTLLILSNRGSGPIVIETTVEGALLHTVDVSAAGARKPADLAYAPASNRSGAMRFYIVDRGVDNNRNPTVVDGKLYEMTAPQSVSRAPLRECPGFEGDRRNQIVGTTGRDVLVGTSADDIICGRGGRDSLRGRGGNDILVGGVRADVLRGGAGRDRLYGGRGADVVRGGSGVDRLRGHWGRDRLRGGDHDDYLSGGRAFDRCRGGPGANELVLCEAR